MRRIPLRCCLILALVVVVNVPAMFIMPDGANATPATEDLNVYQFAPTTTWYVNETVNLTLVIINSLHDEPFFNVSFNHKFPDVFAIDNTTAKAQNSSITYNGTWAHNVTFLWEDPIQPNDTFAFWILLRATQTGPATISKIQIKYQLEDGTPKVAESSNNWDVDVVRPTIVETDTDDDEGLGPEKGKQDYDAPIILLGFILPLTGFALAYCSIYFFRLRRHK
ncbi:MAG: hypothetical protein ACE5OZ_10505 [Candidatus Heimdallarchaeota archaeon]